MKNRDFTFDDWENERWGSNAPPADVLDKLPRPERARDYRPSWGKYSEAARKASATRNAKRHARNVELFRREVLPQVRWWLNPESLFAIGLTLRDAALVRESGWRWWTDGTRGVWLPTGDPRETLAAGKGAAPVPVELAPDLRN